MFFPSILLAATFSIFELVAIASVFINRSRTSSLCLAAVAVSTSSETAPTPYRPALQQNRCRSRTCRGLQRASPVRRASSDGEHTAKGNHADQLFTDQNARANPDHTERDEEPFAHLKATWERK